MKGELANETVNYDTEIMYLFEPEVWLIKDGDIPRERTGSRSSRS